MFWLQIRGRSEEWRELRLPTPSTSSGVIKVGWGTPESSVHNYFLLRDQEGFLAGNNLFPCPAQLLKAEPWDVALTATLRGLAATKDEAHLVRLWESWSDSREPQVSR